MSVLETLADKLVSILSALSAMGALIVSYLSLKKIHEVHVQINSRMDQLLIVTGLKGIAEGKAAEKAEQIERDKTKLE